MPFISKTKIRAPEFYAQMLMGGVGMILPKSLSAVKRCISLIEKEAVKRTDISDLRERLVSILQEGTVFSDLEACAEAFESKIETAKKAARALGEYAKKEFPEQGQFRYIHIATFHGKENIDFPGSKVVITVGGGINEHGKVVEPGVYWLACNDEGIGEARFDEAWLDEITSPDVVNRIQFSGKEIDRFIRKSREFLGSKLVSF